MIVAGLGLALAGGNPSQERAVKRAQPAMHVHAFSPLEVSQGAATLGITARDFLGRLKDEGLGSLPGTAAEILDDVLLGDQPNRHDPADRVGNGVPEHRFRRVLRSRSHLLIAFHAECQPRGILMPPNHTALTKLPFDLSLGKAVAENVTISVTALNLANRRFLLDNSQTFGGTHYAEPRQIYLQVRYRFRL